MRRRQQRLILIGAVGALLALAVALTLMGLRDSVVYFFTPSEIASKAHDGQRVRIGGLVQHGSVRREGDVVRFRVTDAQGGALPVSYRGVLPDLFREGQGVVAEGVWRAHEGFAADRVLAKHDERYMPREVAEALKQRGEWKGPQ
ncbi:MAG: cytochrome c maturation protein CcmE [Hyphomonadaceae bacterium]